MIERALCWGTTAAERAQPFACDALVMGNATAMWRGVTVKAPAALVFRWLCQLRVAPYSYDWIDNWGHQSPPTLTAGLDQLALGQSVMRLFELRAFAPNEHLTVQPKLQNVGASAMTYAVVALDDHTTRLLGKFVIRYPDGPLGWLLRLLLPWGDLIMMRRQLLNFKRLAERDVRSRTVALS